jgi:toxin ParE1/3/4
MPRIIRSPRAKIDIWKIADRIASDNLTASVKFLSNLDHTLETLAKMPGLGPARDELLPGLRSFPIGNYVLFYRRVPTGIELVRVIHGSRDLDEIFDV